MRVQQAASRQGLQSGGLHFGGAYPPTHWQSPNYDPNKKVPTYISPAIAEEKRVGDQLKAKYAADLATLNRNRPPEGPPMDWKAASYKAACQNAKAAIDANNRKFHH
jgi:hypothetical protein